MSELTIELDEQPGEHLRLLVAAVLKFNQEQTGNEPRRSVAYMLRDAQGEIVGGVHGSLWGRCMHIDALWVSDDYRRRGHGAKLMTAIEEYAARQGHPLVFLETATFQALPFYQGLGYRIIGELPEITAGHSLFFLSKDLIAAV